MVRINIIDPKFLADQHLIAEYIEIIMLVEYIRDYPSTDNIPLKYKLGEGHMRFFKDKLTYLKKRHEKLKQEMKKRGFKAKKTLNLKGFPKHLKNDWKPNKADKIIIKKRLIARLNMKPKWYRYYGKNPGKKFLSELIRKA